MWQVQTSKPVSFIKLTPITNEYYSHMSMRVGFILSDPNVEIPESSYSMFTATGSNGCWNNDLIGTGHCRPLLDSVQGWSARNNNKEDYMVIKIPEGTIIEQIGTQGRTALLCSLRGGGCRVLCVCLCTLGMCERDTYDLGNV